MCGYANGLHTALVHHTTGLEHEQARSHGCIIGFKSIAAFHASSQCATRKVLFIGELDRFGLSQQSFVEDDRSVFD